MKQKKLKPAKASLDALYRVFTVPEHERSTLGRIEREISENLNGFLKAHIVASTAAPKELEKDFVETAIPDDPIYVSEQAEYLLSQVVSRSVHTASPSFIGHMTSALPYFMFPLAKIMIALNQNLVKIETSKAFTPLERQVIGMLHRLVFELDAGFYKKNTQNYGCSLGAFCSDGTIANITCLWVALNRLLKPKGLFKGVGEEGLFAAMGYYGYKSIKVFVSERGHYSLKKAANVLGIGRKNIVSIPVDENNKIDLTALNHHLETCIRGGHAVAAVVGVAGTTETGSVDPLDEMASLCKRHGVFFHVDAAWGGPTLFSRKHGSLLKGIERADSVTFDTHKQLYVPVGAGIALFKNHKDLALVEHTADYIIRKGSRDLGRTTLEGSRPGMAMLVHSALRIIGRKGYEMLIDMGIEKAQKFASLIRKQGDFELITNPELNLLTYRYRPEVLKDRLAKGSPKEVLHLNKQLNALTVSIQKEQRDSGKTFVSRTVLKPFKYDKQEVCVFRVVLANPLTTEEIFQEVLSEQRSIGLKLLEGQFDDVHTGTFT